MSFIKSDEVNYLIYRYLQESGFIHSAFIFANESQVTSTSINGSLVPAAALLNLIQKGLHYIEAEIGIGEDDNQKNIVQLSLIDAVLPDIVPQRQRQLANANNNSSSVICYVSNNNSSNNNSSIVASEPTQSGPSVCPVSKSTPEVIKTNNHTPKSSSINNSSNVLVNNVPKNLFNSSASSSKLDHNNNSSSYNLRSNGSSNNNTLNNSSFNNNSSKNGASGNNLQSFVSKPTPEVIKTESNGRKDSSSFLVPTSASSVNQQIPPTLSSSNSSNAPQPMDTTPSSAPTSGNSHIQPRTGILPEETLNNGNGPIEIPDSRVKVLRGHEKDVFSCAWHPSSDTLASASGDSTARIWNLNQQSDFEANQIVFRHYIKRNGVKSPSHGDITSLEWNPDGKLLATGSHDYIARIWNVENQLVHELNGHRAPVLSVKWNEKGSYLLTASEDKTTIVWSATTGKAVQYYKCHTKSVLEIDWRSNSSFASCSSDKTIQILKVGEPYPTKTFKGHTEDVNSIKWDPHKTFLASCSDDQTVKIWTTKQPSFVKNFRGHEASIFTVKWSPTTANIASGSFDHTVRLWELERGLCLHTLHKHTEPIYSIAFSPDGKLIASGAHDSHVYIWCTNSGQLVNSFEATDGVFEVCWNKSGDKLGVAESRGNVYVLDMRR
ncbi:F-box-like/WD repeat-containing protein TBL1XR1 [Tetranychus urticae]|uniref:WD repeat-containing protein 55 homolog n=1 Tax=Tetranychus urticae TaxID=32264 RepID=T1K4V0_TETUR|nr:F-box-like/WD repeat-containing protein TBL1XR1 [Tetranychus urticae]